MGFWTAYMGIEGGGGGSTPTPSTAVVPVCVCVRFHTARTIGPNINTLASLSRDFHTATTIESDFGDCHICP